MRISHYSVLYVSLITYICCDLCSLLSQANDPQNRDDGGKTTTTKKRGLPKDPLFITDLDLENLYDEWEETDDDPLPPDELPPHKRPPPKLNIPSGDSDLLKDPEKLMRASKKGKTVMAFVTVANNPSKEETEALTQRWQVGLTNNHMKCERFVIADDRAIFVFEDGSLAFEAKDYFTEQPELKEYSIDNRVWQGKGFPVEYINKQDQKLESAKTEAEQSARPVKDEL